MAHFIYSGFQVVVVVEFFRAKKLANAYLMAISSNYWQAKKSNKHKLSSLLLLQLTDLHLSLLLLLLVGSSLQFYAHTFWQPFPFLPFNTRKDSIEIRLNGHFVIVVVVTYFASVSYSFLLFACTCSCKAIQCNSMQHLLWGSTKQFNTWSHFIMDNNLQIREKNISCIILRKEKRKYFSHWIACIKKVRRDFEAWYFNNIQAF